MTLIIHFTLLLDNTITIKATSVEIILAYLIMSSRHNSISIAIYPQSIADYLNLMDIYHSKPPLFDYYAFILGCTFNDGQLMIISKLPIRQHRPQSKSNDVSVPIDPTLYTMMDIGYRNPPPSVITMHPFWSVHSMTVN